MTVAGREDDDGEDDTVSLAHAATSADTDYAGLEVAAVAVTVTDNDVPGLTVSTTALAVDEPGTATYSVRLNTEPGGAVTVGIADTTNNADVSTGPSGTGALEFTTASWETAQTVTVTVAADDDAADDTATLAHTVEGTGDTTDYPTTLAAVNVTVTVEDADTAGVTVSETALALTEEYATDGSGTYTVVLDTQPTAPVTVTVVLDTQPTAPAPVTVTSDDAAVALDTDATPQTRELTFSSTNWATAQAVTASAAADDDAVDERATITHTLAGAAEYAGSAGPPVVAAVTVALVTVTVADDEEQGLTLNPTTVTVTEDGSETYTVVLTSEPTGPVVVRIGSDNADMDVQPRLLQYTASTWDTAQTVRVQADADDDVQAATATLTHTAAGGDYTGLAAETLAVSVTDSDATNVGRHLVLSRRGLTTEVGAPRTYTVGLRVQPAGPVTVTVLSGQTPQAPVTVDTDDSPHNLALVFTAGNWQTAQTVTVTGVTTVDSLNLTHRLDGYGATNQDAARLSVTVAPAGAHLLIGPRVLRVTEGGPSETYTVRLATDPTGSATVTVGTATGSDIGTVSQAPGVLTFTGGATGNWGTAQTVTVTVAADGNTVAGSATFSHTAGGYSAGQALYLSMTVQEIEDETPTLGVVAAQTYRAGQRVSVRLPGATGGNPPVEHTLTGPLPATTSLTLPDGLTYDAATRRLRGTPATAATAATYTLTATDADGDANTPTRTFAVTVAANPLPGFATWEPRRDPYPLNQAIDPPQQLPAPRNPDGQSLTFFVTPALPAGLTYIPPMREEMEGVTVYLSGGQIVGTPTVRTSQRQYTLTMVDANHNEAEVTFALATGAQPASADRQPTFGEQTVADQTYTVGTAVTLTLPAATGGDGGLTHTLTGPAGAGPPAGLNCTPPAVEEAHGGTLSGTPAEAQPATPYTLTATDADGDVATLTFRVTVVRVQARVTIADATAEEGTPVQFRVTVSRSLAAPLTLHWTAGRPGSATPGEDYHAVAAGQTTLAAGATAGTLVVRTLDDRRVEPTETFTVTVTLPAETSIELAQDMVEGRIEDDDTEQARKRSLGMVLAGMGRTLATDAVDVIGDRFVRQPSAAQATVGGQALELERTPQRGRWRHAAGVAYGVARALGLEVGSPLAGGDGQFGQVRGAAWSTLTRHLRDPHAPTPPLSALDAPAPLSNASWSPSIPPPSGRGLGGGSSAGDSPADATPFRRPHLPSVAGCGDGLDRLGCGPEARVPRNLAGYGHGLGQLGFDRAHAATPQAVQVGTLRAPVQFRRVSGAEVLSQSQFEVLLSRPAPASLRARPQPGHRSNRQAQAAAATWTLWGRGTASGFNGKPKDNFSMDGTVFTGYLGVDYRLQPNVLLGLAVSHSQGDVDYETTDVTKGDVDVTLTSILPYAHWSPRPGLGVWGLFGAGWGNLKLRDEAGKVKTDLELLLGAVGARQEVVTWRQIDVALKADAFLTELEAGSDDRLPKTAGDAQRLRLMVEGRTAWALSEDSHLTPAFEIGGRWDGGKAETGVGVEMGGGLAYAHTKLGLGIEARWRYLLAHQKSAFDEWGVSLTLRLDPGADKRGLWLALAPVWGAEASQVEQMWGSAEVLRASGETDTTPSLSPAQVEFDVGYGMVTHEGLGLLTTYGGLSLLGPESHGVRLGGRLALGAWIDLSVEGERTTQGGSADHQVALYGHLGW